MRAKKSSGLTSYDAGIPGSMSGNVMSESEGNEHPLEFGCVHQFRTLSGGNVRFHVITRMNMRPTFSKTVEDTHDSGNKYKYLDPCICASLCL